MRIKVVLTISFTIILDLCTQRLRAQDSKINSNLGVGFALPQGSTGNLVGPNVNVVVGVGYNIDKHHSLVGQFMWAGLPIDKQAFRPVSVVNDRNVGSSSNLFALTANYQYRLQGNVFGVYWIGGGGMYYRHASLSKEVLVGVGTACGPLWQWHGFACVDGIVTDDRTLRQHRLHRFGRECRDGTDDPD